MSAPQLSAVAEVRAASQDTWLVEAFSAEDTEARAEKLFGGVDPWGIESLAHAAVSWVLQLHHALGAPPRNVSATRFSPFGTSCVAIRRRAGGSRAPLELNVTCERDGPYALLSGRARLGLLQAEARPRNGHVTAT